MANLASMLIIVMFLIISSLQLAEADHERKVYIAYLGALSAGTSTMSVHLSILEKVLEGSTVGESLIYSYKKSFSGFAAKLTEMEAEKLARMEGVVSVFPSRKLKLHTTRSWDFLGIPQTVKRETQVESDLIVGVMDTGIWPGSKSFSDKGMGPPPTKWKGICQNMTCNNKIIGARVFYSGNQTLNEERSPIDLLGHGSHTASTIAGREVRKASFYGLAKGTSRGAVPSARIAVYKVCWKFDPEPDCLTQDVLAAMDAAIHDGVDMISASLGDPEALQYFNDGIAIGAFHAMKNGILTSLSAGNVGPELGSVTNVAPWVLTVAASTSDRRMVGKLKLGDGTRLSGYTINRFPDQKVLYPLIVGKNDDTKSDGKSARNGFSNLFNHSMKGKNVLCLSPNVVEIAKTSSAQGVIWNGYNFGNLTCPVVPLPVVCLNDPDTEKVHKYMNKTRSPVGQIYKSRDNYGGKASIVISFSARGPNLVTPEILKPDISAPGVDILAAWSPKANPSPFPGEPSSMFNIASGTSMSCPHVTGAALYVKSFHPSWSPSAIKSALMTTASPMTDEQNPDAELAYGAGQVNPVQAVDPGLIYNAEESDYINFLCNEGLDVETIKNISGDLDVHCPVNAGRARDLNYPSMTAVVDPSQPFKVEFSRTVTNVGVANSTYIASISSTANYLNASVVPTVISFVSLNTKQQFMVTISGGPLGKEKFISASLTWSDGQHIVRSPIVVMVNTTRSS